MKSKTFLVLCTGFYLLVSLFAMGMIALRVAIVRETHRLTFFGLYGYKHETEHIPAIGLFVTGPLLFLYGILMIVLMHRRNMKPFAIDIIFLLVSALSVVFSFSSGFNAFASSKSSYNSSYYRTMGLYYMFIAMFSCAELSFCSLQCLWSWKLKCNEYLLEASRSVPGSTLPISRAPLQPIRQQTNPPSYDFVLKSSAPPSYA